MSTDDRDRSTILAAARAQRNAYFRGLLILPVCAAIALYRPSANAYWGWLGVLFAVQLVVIAFQLNAARLTSQKWPAMRALLDEPARITAIETRRSAVLVYLDLRSFTILRLPAEAPTAFLAMLRARCPQAGVRRPR
jgi:hypothetical protein